MNQIHLVLVGPPGDGRDIRLALRYSLKYFIQQSTAAVPGNLDIHAVVGFNRFFPLHLDNSCGFLPVLLRRNIRAVGPVNRNAASTSNIPNDIVARNRIAASGEPDEQIIYSFYGNPVRRPLLLRRWSLHFLDFRSQLDNAGLFLLLTELLSYLGTYL
ncbi:hypothetical protein D3C71_1684830 [compost metagenome]